MEIGGLVGFGKSTESPLLRHLCEVFTSEVRAVPKRRDQRSRSPLRRSVPEPKGSPKRSVPEPKVGPKKKKVIADFEEIQEEPLVASGPSSGSGLTGSRPVVIRPSKRKAESPKAEAKKRLRRKGRRLKRQKLRPGGRLKRQKLKPRRRLTRKHD